MRLHETGQLKPNPSTDNFGLAIPACDPCGKYPTCEDRFTIGNTASVTSLTLEYMGEEKVVNFAAAVGASAVQAAVLNAVSEFEIEPTVKVVSGATSFALTHVGGAKLTKVGAINVAKRECEIVTVCEHKINYAGGTGDVFTAGTTDTTLPALVYGTQTPADVQTALQPLVVAQSPTATVEVLDDASNGVFAITIKDLSKEVYKIAGTLFLPCNCAEVFKA